MTDAAINIVNEICEKDRLTNRENILAFEEIAKELPQVDIPVKHYIHGGMYVREITIPKDTILTGQIYKFDHFDVMISGDITVSTDSGESKRFNGYNLFKGMAGKKRAGYAHEDTTWITVHPFSGSDGDEIQKFITADSFEELEFFNVTVNRADYESMVDSMLISQKEIDIQVENSEDMIDLPDCYDYLYVSDSKIEGKGFFSSVEIKSGCIICPSRLKDKRTPAGRYINHALIPNCEMRFLDGSIFVVATRDIEPHEEITVNYRDVMNTRNSEGDLLCPE